MTLSAPPRARQFPGPGFSQLRSIKAWRLLVDKGRKSAPRLHVRVRKPQLLAFLVGDDLLEGLAEIEIEIVPFGPTEMRHAQRVGHFQQGVIAAGDRFVLVNVDSGVTGPAGLQDRKSGV